MWERGFRIKPLSNFSLFFAVFLPRRSVIAVREGAEEKDKRDRLHRSSGRTLPETDWRDLAQLSVPDSRNHPLGNWNICLSLARSLCLAFSSSLSVPISHSPFFLISQPSSVSVSFSFSLHPPLADALLPSPSSPSHGQLARLLESLQFLHPKCRSPRRRSFSCRLQRVLPLHSQRDKTQKEDDPGPTGDPRTDLCP